MTSIHGDTVQGVFNDAERAHAAVEKLVAAGFHQTALQSGLHEAHGSLIERSLEIGHLLVVVNTDSRQAEAAQLLDELGAERIGPPADDSSPESRHKPLHFGHDMSSPAGGFTASGGLASDHPPAFHVHHPDANSDAPEATDGD